MGGNSERFLSFVSRNYDRLKTKMVKYCVSKGVVFDEDVYSDTILKIHDKIEKEGMTDETENGYENYIFMSFRTNILRERQYSRNKSSDDNIDQESIGELYDRYYNGVNDSSVVKLAKDLRTDYRTLQVLLLVEKNFTPEQYYLFKLKFLEQLTYKELAERTGVKDARNKVLAVLQWLRENANEINKQIDDSFKEQYDDVIEQI